MREEVTGACEILHNELLHFMLYWSLQILRVTVSRRLKWTGHVVYMREECACRGLVQIAEGKSPHGRFGHIYDYNIRGVLKGNKMAGWRLDSHGSG